jgi:tetratricopeptide (TPR) repeat protein
MRGIGTILGAFAVLVLMIFAGFFGYLTGAQEGNDSPDKSAQKRILESVKESLQKEHDTEIAELRKEYEEKLGAGAGALEAKEKEIEALKKENLKLAGEKKGTGKPSAGNMADIAAAASDNASNTGAEKERKIAEKIGELLAQIAQFPGDRNIMEELSGQLWRCQNASALEAWMKRLHEIYDTALENDPENIDLLYNQAAAMSADLSYYRLKMKDDPMRHGMTMGEAAMKAINGFGKVLKKNPNDHQAMVSRGFFCFYMPGQLDQAEEDFKGLISLAKKHAVDEGTGVAAFTGMAMTYDKMGKTEEAKKAIQDGLSIYPDSDTLRNWEERLERK